MELSALVSSANTGSAQESSVGLTEDFSTFLTLLTEQLKNQDPLEPLDTNEFTSQLVEFASGEADIETHAHLETLISLQESNASAGAVDYLGKTVSVFGDEATLADGSALWSYDVDAGAENVLVEVLSSSGSVVYSEAGEISAGRHDFTWTGQALDGTTQPDGVYRLRVSAEDGDGAPVSTNTVSRQTVEKVNFEESDGATVTLNDILFVEN